MNIEETQKSFDERVIYLLKSGHSAIDAILDWCSISGIEPEAVGQFISEPLKQKLEQEGIELHLLKNPAGKKKKSVKLDV